MAAHTSIPVCAPDRHKTRCVGVLRYAQALPWFSLFSMFTHTLREVRSSAQR